MLRSASNSAVADETKDDLEMTLMQLILLAMDILDHLAVAAKGTGQVEVIGDFSHISTNPATSCRFVGKPRSFPL